MHSTPACMSIEHQKLVLYIYAVSYVYNVIISIIIILKILLEYYSNVLYIYFGKQEKVTAESV